MIAEIYDFVFLTGRPSAFNIKSTIKSTIISKGQFFRSHALIAMKTVINVIILLTPNCVMLLLKKEIGARIVANPVKSFVIIKIVKCVFQRVWPLLIKIK